MNRLLSTVAALAIVTAVAVPAIAQISNTPGATAATVTTQLPRSVRPSHYDLTIVPDAAALSFTGKVAITIDVVTATDTITLNAIDMTFGPVTLATTAGKPVGTASTTIDAAHQTASFRFAKSVAPGSYVLTTSYTGKIGTQATGLFALDYDGADGRKQRALYTQFENSDARRFVPSWDEPFYKATFSLKAVVPANQMAVSNLPVASRTPAGPGKVLVTFGDSPRMSTYLLFFGVGDFERATKQAGGAEIGVITKRGDLRKAQFALDSAAEILPWYNDYFGVHYPLPKLDHIAGPGQSQFFAAMENWGAIFYFEYAMEVDPAITTEQDKQGIFIDFAHEMAHQWFGDLVTMAWWDDLWLNEGFASWMETRATEHFHPEWHIELDTIAGRNGAMSQDALVTTHPIVQHIATVDEAAQAFDSITYQKGEAVIRMLEGYAGSAAWQAGVQAYMKKYAHTNTVTDDLWREMETATGKPITQIAHDFTLQPGVPLIRASASCKAGTTTLALDQGEYTKDRPNKAPLSWHVPVIAAVPGGKPSQTVVAGKASLAVAGCGPVIVNVGQSGYYRTLYTPAMFAAIARDYAKVAPLDQLGVMSDASALGLVGLEPMSDVLDLAAGLPADAQPQVIESAASVFLSLYGYADGVPARQAALVKFASARFLPILTKLGWTPVAGEPTPVANLRDTLIGALGGIGEPTVVAEARRRFAAAATDPKAIAPTLRRTITGVVAINADQATWDKLRAMAKAEKSALAKATLYIELGLAKDPKLADRALALALTDEPGATTSPTIIDNVSSNFPDKTFAFALANQKAVMAKVDTSSAARFIVRLIQRSYDPAAIGKVQAWAQANLPKEAMRASDEVVAAIKYRIQVRDQRMPAVDAWLKTKGY